MTPESWALIARAMLAGIRKSWDLSCHYDTGQLTRSHVEYFGERHLEEARVSDTPGVRSLAELKDMFISEVHRCVRDEQPVLDPDTDVQSTWRHVPFWGQVIAHPRPGLRIQIVPTIRFRTDSPHALADVPLHAENDGRLWVPWTLTDNEADSFWLLIRPHDMPSECLMPLARLQAP